jgi:hypothetical protein
MRFWKKRFELSVILGLSFLLVGCGPFFNFSPESAAVQAVMTGHPGDQVLSDTITVLQKQEHPGAVVVMLKYQMVNEGLLFSCDYVYEVQKRVFGWTPAGGGGGCSSGPTDDQQISLSGGTRSSGAESSSQTYGLVYDPEITSIEVEWDDGMLQRADVINSSYLLVRKGQNHWTRVSGYDSNEEMVYNQEQSDPPPGKMLP